MATPRYDSIMVPLDRSEFAEAALPLATSVAAGMKAVLHLVSVSTGGVDDHYLDRIAEEYSTGSGVSIVTADLGGETLEALAEYVGENGIELMVIATHGADGWARIWRGSLTASLIKEIDIPFLTIRPTGERGPGAHSYPPITHIVIPLDGSPAAEAVLGHAITLGGPEVRISLIQVIPAPVPNDPVSISLALMDDDDTRAAREERAMAYLDAIALDISGLVRRVDTALILEPSPADAIIAFADQEGADLIAASTYGSGGIRSGGLGSIAGALLRSAEVPVLVFRPPEP